MAVSNRLFNMENMVHAFRQHPLWENKERKIPQVSLSRKAMLLLGNDLSYVKVTMNCETVALIMLSSVL